MCIPALKCGCFSPLFLPGICSSCEAALLSDAAMDASNETNYGTQASQWAPASFVVNGVITTGKHFQLHVAIVHISVQCSRFYLSLARSRSGCFAITPKCNEDKCASTSIVLLIISLFVQPLALIPPVIACLFYVLFVGLSRVYLSPFPCWLNVIELSSSMNVAAGFTLWRVVDLVFASILTRERVKVMEVRGRDSLTMYLNFEAVEEGDENDNDDHAGAADHADASAARRRRSAKPRGNCFVRHRWLKGSWQLAAMVGGVQIAFLVIVFSLALSDPMITTDDEFKCDVATSGAYQTELLEILCYIAFFFLLAYQLRGADNDNFGLLQVLAPLLRVSRQTLLSRSFAWKASG